MGEEAPPYPSSTTSTLPHDDEKSQPLPQKSAVCTHHQPTTLTNPAYSNLTQLLHAPSTRQHLQSLINHLQRILDEEQCTACAVEDGVKSATEGAMEAKRAKKEYKRSGGQKIEGWNKETVWGARKEVKGIVKGVKAEWKRGEKGAKV